MTLLRFTVHKAELSRDGLLITNLSHEGDAVRREVATLAEIEPIAAELASAYGSPCAVWVGVANNGRKPRGFDAAARLVDRKFRNEPAQSVEVAS